MENYFDQVAPAILLITFHLFLRWINMSSGEESEKISIMRDQIEDLNKIIASEREQMYAIEQELIEYREIIENMRKKI